MPNGYTSDIHEGKPGADTARAYLWQCVRGFGVCFEQRDDDWRSAIKMPSVPTYHTEQLALDEAELLEVQARSEEKWQSLYDIAMEKALQEAEAHRTKHEAIHARYEKVRLEIEAMDFDPMFDNLKKTSLEWIQQSDNWDCHSDYYDKQIVSFEEWKAEQIKHAEWGVSYHKREQEKEMKGYYERLEYIQKLIELLGEPPQGLK